MKESLNATLQKWASLNRTPDAKLHAMAARVSEEAARRHHSQRFVTEVPARRMHTGWKVAWAACGVAAVLLILFAFGPVRFHEAPVSIDLADGAPTEPALIDNQQRISGQRLFTEMEHLFADQFRWMAEFNGHTELAVEPITGGLSSDSMPVQYRLTVMTRAAGDATWRTAWSTDILLRTEEWVDIRPAQWRAGDYLTLWVHRVEDNTLAVDTSLSLETPVRVESQITRLQRDREPEEILAWRESDTEYRILQTIALEDSRS